MACDLAVTQYQLHLVIYLGPPPRSQRGEQKPLPSYAMVFEKPGPHCALQELVRTDSFQSLLLPKSRPTWGEASSSSLSLLHSPKCLCLQGSPPCFLCSVPRFCPAQGGTASMGSNMFCFIHSLASTSCPLCA